jgi:hypothetical protein
MSLFGGKWDFWCEYLFTERNHEQRRRSASASRSGASARLATMAENAPQFCSSPFTEPGGCCMAWCARAETLRLKRYGQSCHACNLCTNIFEWVSKVHQGFILLDNHNLSVTRGKKICLPTVQISKVFSDTFAAFSTDTAWCSNKHRDVVN